MTESLEPVRLRPGMYFGGTDEAGLSHLVFEVIGNSVDQHLMGRATRISIDVSDGWLTVSDDGDGISVEREEHVGMPWLESVFTSMHATPTRDGPRPHVHLTSTQFGLGLGPVSAVCERLEVESNREGVRYRAVFARGTTVEPLTAVGASQARGVTVRLLPDAQIFAEHRVDAGSLRSRVRELASLTPGLSWRLQGEDLSRPDGLVSVIQPADGVLEPGSFGEFSAEIDDAQVVFAVGLRQGALAAKRRGALAERLPSWVNLRRTTDGGPHVKGMLAGLTDAFGKRWRLLEPRFEGALHLVLAHPKFEGPTRAKLAVPAMERVVREFVADELTAETDLRVTWIEALSKLQG